MTPLAKEFENAMLHNVELMSTRCNFHPRVFKEMLAELGGVGAARQLLRGARGQAALRRLGQIGCLDLSMEATVLQDRFRSLFTEAEINEAHRRLSDLGYFREQHP